MESLAHIVRVRRPLLREMHELEASRIHFEIMELGSLLAHIQAQSSFVEKVKVTQEEDPKLYKLRDRVWEGKAHRLTLDKECYGMRTDRVCWILS